MAKLTATERKAWEKDLATLRAAVEQCLQVLKADDEAEKSAKAASDSETVASIAKRDGTAAGIQAARLMGRRGGPQD
jgi:hypothetical protein